MITLIIFFTTIDLRAFYKSDYNRLRPHPCVFSDIIQYVNPTFMSSALFNYLEFCRLSNHDTP